MVYIRNVNYLYETTSSFEGWLYIYVGCIKKHLHSQYMTIWYSVSNSIRLKALLHTYSNTIEPKEPVKRTPRPRTVRIVYNKPSHSNGKGHH